MNTRPNPRHALNRLARLLALCALATSPAIQAAQNGDAAAAGSAPAASPAAPVAAAPLSFKDLAPEGREKLLRSRRTGGVQPRALVHGRPVAPDIQAPAPAAAGARTEGERWLPGYKPETERAIVEYNNWKRQQIGMPALELAGRDSAKPNGRKNARGKKGAAAPADGAPGHATPPGTTRVTGQECRDLPAPGRVTVNPAVPAAQGSAEPPQIPAENRGATPIGRAPETAPAPAPAATQQAEPATPAPEADRRPRAPGAASTGAPSASGAPTLNRVILNQSVSATDVPSLIDRPYVAPDLSGFYGRKEVGFLSEQEEEVAMEQSLRQPPTPGMQHADAPFLQRPKVPLAPTPGASFDGPDATVGGGYPPDPILAVGPNHVVAAVNVSYQVFNKTGTRLLNSTFATLFSSTPNCSGFLYDPWVDYDEANDRWVMGVDRGSSSASTYICIAASKTADPTGGWWTYGFDANINHAGTWLDNLDMAIGQDAVYLGGNLFTDALAFSTSIVYAINKTQMYSGAAAQFAEFDAGATFFNPNPATIRGYNAGQWPSPTTPMYIAMSTATQVRLLSWINPFVPTAPATYGTVTVTTATLPPATVQSGTGGTNDSGDYRWNDAEYRNGRLWLTRGSGCNPGAGVVACAHWVELNVSGVSPTIVQQGMFGANNSYRTYPDLAVDRNNSMAIGYTRSASTEFPSVAVTGRDSADAPNTLQAETLVTAGAITYNDGDVTPHRWGDYTGMTIDPDGCRFWYLGEYSKNIAVPNWGTRIASFQFASCNINSSITVNKALYSCTDSVQVTVTDVTAVPNTFVASQVTISSSAGDSETIPAGSWVGSSCTAGNCTTWTASIATTNAAATPGNGVLSVANAGTLTALYTDTHPTHTNQSRTVNVSCTPDIADGGYLIAGGCDESATGPEKYTSYMDNGELVSYTVGIYNSSYSDLTDVHVDLTKSGAGAANLTVLGPTSLVIGRIPARSVSGAVFSFSISGAAAMTPVNLNFAVSSPLDGFTTPLVLTQAHFLESDDAITGQEVCRNHNTADMTPRGYATPAINLPWSAITTASCGGETRTDGTCFNATVGVYKTNTCTSNFASDADEILFLNPVQPVNRGDFSPGIPWRYAWKIHSTYGSTHTVGNTSGVYGVYYHNDYGSATAPTAGNAIDAFPYSIAYYYQTIWDSTASWDWEAANTGTPDSLTAAPPNQVVFDLAGIDGLSLANTYFSFGHEGLDLHVLTGGTNGANNRGFALDNDHLMWDEYHTAADANSCATQCGTIGLDRFLYSNIAGDAVTITVVDGNAGAGPLSVTITTGTGDSETVSLAKVGAEPRYTGTIQLYHDRGNSPGDGMLYTNPADLLTAVYSDADNGAGAPCSDTATATVSVPGGDVVYVSNAISTSPAESNGDLDAYADTNETVSMSITIKNNMATPLTNTKVRISAPSTNIDCVIADQVNLGTVAAGASAATPSTFKFHVRNTTNCSNFQAPPNGLFTVYITGDNFAGPTSAQVFALPLDLNAFNGPGFTYTQDFTTDPGWQFGTGPGDDDGTCAGQAYVNDFKYTATNGRTGGGYTAWTGDTAFGGGGTYRPFGDSALYSPVFTTTGNPVLTFDRAYYMENGYDGAAVQVSVNGGAWSYLTGFTGMAAFAPAVAYCNPLSSTATLWTGGPAAWATTNGVTITAAANATFQIRWRMGSDSTIVRNGYAIDNVSITNVKQTVACDATNNSALPACPSAAPKPVPDGQFVTGTPMTGAKSGGNVIVTYTVAGCGGGATNYNVLWGTFPITSATQAFTGGSCGVGTTGSWTGAIPNNAWWVVVGTDGAANYSSFGRNNAGAEETFTGAPTICATQTTQNTGGTCP